MPRKIVSVASVLSALPVLFLWSSPALAHGGSWLADQILVEPGQPNHMLLRSDAWGVIETVDGASWHWVCGEDYGVTSLISSGTDHRSMVVLPGGDTLVVADFNGLRRSKVGLCNFETVGGFEQRGRCGGRDCITVGVSRSWESERGIVVATELPIGFGDAATLPDLLWHSPDGGDHWDATPKAFPVGVNAKSVVVAPSETKTIYATARPYAAADPSRIPLSSHDGGTSWQQAAPVDSSGSTSSTFDPDFRVQGVNPLDAQMAFFLLDYGDTVEPGADRLYESTDGGATLNLVFQAKGNLQGLAFSGDAKTLFVGGELDGLLRASVADLPSKRKSAFTQLDTKGFAGLAWTPSGLYAGRVDKDINPIQDRYVLGLSTDMGQSFVPKFNLCDVTLADCAADTSYGKSCSRWFMGAGNFYGDFLAPDQRRCVKTPEIIDAGPDAEVTVRDAQVAQKDASVINPPSASPSSGCSCEIPASSKGERDDVPRVLLLLSLSGLVRRLRRLK